MNYLVLSEAIQVIRCKFVSKNYIFYSAKRASVVAFLRQEKKQFLLHKAFHCYLG